jgi:hypothetical protein
MWVVVGLILCPASPLRRLQAAAVWDPNLTSNHVQSSQLSVVE